MEAIIGPPTWEWEYVGPGSLSEGTLRAAAGGFARWFEEESLRLAAAKDVAAKYSVSPSTVYDIRASRAWRGVTERLRKRKVGRRFRGDPPSGARG